MNLMKRYLKINDGSLYCIYMDDTHKMLRSIINGQSAMKQELVMTIRGVEKRLGNRIDGVEKRIDGLENKIDGVEKRLTERIDKIGLAEAELEDDTPTREEFDSLENRVSTIETNVVLA